MSSDQKILFIYGITFFTFCVSLIVHMLFLFTDYDVKRAIFIYTLIYGCASLLLETYKQINKSIYTISLGRFIGLIIGLSAGFYTGYQVNVLLKIGSLESSNIAVGVCFMFGIANSKLGSYLGNKILPTKTN